jgi:hypothetical protein
MNSTVDCYFPMSFELHNKNKYDFECKDMAHILYMDYHIFYIGRYGGDFVEKYAQGIWI